MISSLKTLNLSHMMFLPLDLHPYNSLLARGGRGGGGGGLSASSSSPNDDVGCAFRPRRPNICPTAPMKALARLLPPPVLSPGECSFAFFIRNRPGKQKGGANKFSRSLAPHFLL